MLFKDMKNKNIIPKKMVHVALTEAGAVLVTMDLAIVCVAPYAAAAAKAEAKPIYTCFFICFWEVVICVSSYKVPLLSLLPRLGYLDLPLRLFALREK